MSRLLLAVSLSMTASVAGRLAAQETPSPPPQKPPAFVVSKPPGELPAKVIDRMKVPITAKFTLPLEVAFQEIFQAVDVKCVLDGVALKSAGITKNEVQKLSLEQKPVHEVLRALLDRSDRKQTYPEVVLIIDEEKKFVMVTTRADAAARKLTPVDFEQFRKE